MADTVDRLAAEGRVSGQFASQYPYLRPLLPPAAEQRALFERYEDAKARVEELVAGGMTRHEATMAVIRAAQDG
jgi:hypothetical protein